MTVTLLAAMMPADQVKNPQLDYAQSGGQLHFYEWSCSTGREEGVRQEVRAALSQFVNTARIALLMREFDLELERMGYGTALPLGTALRAA